MEDKNKKNYNNYNIIKSPIVNYYSHYVNPSSLSLSTDSEKSNIQPKNFFQINQFPISQQKIENPQGNKSNELFEENNKEEPKNESNDENINLKKETELNSIEKENENSEKEKKGRKSKNFNKKIKSINTYDLIPTSINGHLILRINPLVYKNESYEFLSSNLYLLLKDQLACKYLQEKLDFDTQKAICYFYPALIPNLLFLIRDSFANYFIQKICYFLNEEQIQNILQILTPEFMDICSDIHGTRAIQGIMNNLQTEKLRSLFFSIIQPNFISLIYDVNGIHVIYKFINEFPEFINQLNSIIFNNCLTLATHKRGCSFLQNYLIMLNNIKSEYRQNIINNLLNNCLILITDKIGNYLVQYLLSLNDDKIISKISNKIVNNISFYSKHKYSNYAVEKIFIFANPNDRNKIIAKIATPEIMSDLIFDQQGNYIIIKALLVADDEKRNIMLNIINNLEPKIKKLPYGNNFLNKVYNNFNIKNPINIRTKDENK